MKLSIQLHFLTLASALFVAVLPRVGAAAPKISFSELLSDRVVCEDEEGEVFCDAVTKGSYAFSFSSEWATDITQIAPETQVEISFGAFQLSAPLSEATRYTAGKSTATFTVGDFDENDHFVAYGRVQLKWSKKRFSVKVSGRTGGFSELSPVLAGPYIESEPGPVFETVPLRVSFAGLDTTVPISVRGGVMHCTSIRGEDVFNLRKVTLRGKPEVEFE